MKAPSAPPSTEVPGFSSLADIPLEESLLSFLDHALSRNRGPAAFQKRKAAETRDFLALAQVSEGRLIPLAANLENSLHLQFLLNAPVPVMESDGELRVFSRALIHLRYPEEALRLPQAGYNFVQILQPRGVFLPNVASPAQQGIDQPTPQALCLGTQLPPGIRVRELVLMTYGALTLQSVQMDATDPAGVLNLEAATWWQGNPHRIPLTTEPFCVR